MGRAREKRRVEDRKSEKRKSKKKEDADARKGRKVSKHCVFPMICGSGGLKSRLAKAAGVELSGQMRDEQLHAVVARSTIVLTQINSSSIRRHIVWASYFILNVLNPHFCWLTHLEFLHASFLSGSYWCLIVGNGGMIYNNI